MDLRRLAWRVLWILVALALMGALVSWALESAGGPEALRAQYGPASALVLVPLLSVLSLAPLPPETFAIGIAVLYGPWWGALLIWLGWMGTAFLQYAIFRRSARGVDLEAVAARLPPRLRRLRVDHPLFLIAGYWLPFVGPHVVNSAAGAAGVPLGRFAWCAALGVATGAILVSSVTTAVLKLIWP